MSDTSPEATSLSAVIARLDALNATLTRIAIALETGQGGNAQRTAAVVKARPAVAATAVAAAAGAAAGRAAAVDAAAAGGGAGTRPVEAPRPVPVAAEPPKATSADARPATGQEPQDDGGAAPEDLAPVGPPPEASVDVVVGELFRAVLIEDVHERWDHMVALTYSGDLAAPRALDNLKAFSWKRLGKNVDRYLTGLDPATFKIVRTIPADPPPDADTLKVFLSSKVGSPAPISLRRDADAGGAWRITNVSL